MIDQQRVVHDWDSGEVNYTWFSNIFINKNMLLWCPLGIGIYCNFLIMETFV